MNSWADIFYVPRRFFADFIALSDIFHAVPVFLEIGVATMLHIIDQTYREHPSRSVITRLGDCWGGCCASYPRSEDVLWNRCGHKFDFATQDIVDVIFGHLEESRVELGERIGGARQGSEEMVRLDLDQEGEPEHERTKEMVELEMMEELEQDVERVMYV